ncbi:haloacid dehalogenase type II [Nocardia terpenica]|uniref:Haloacid dehalogenase n=1 Tax=Nocardia terpenica TaxID=455432 RepID=A0A164N281_9NOCA|nr:haloacid dehalogenase type II [Nocardia terpenica]KZM73899.1 haloacid dehalogenase [Nocardia terpenica]MBF6059643.1 haloacid dehalogenase type II [Nocardia terpenica]MBF6102816.1 haloacid dehalogenase type II [Nocardia terpenica]MBF6110993.1 haloacid dehalogenase type II [Nocardia terpenica]MBF6117124.1 haloacid dehalogenase type II [Nocardia terpenica]
MSHGPQALLFDVQGTATDFHSTITREAHRIAGSRYPDRDWAAFVNDWRAAYSSGLRSIGTSAEKWTSVESVYRTALDDLLDRHGMDLSESERHELTGAWKRLDPWPDAVAGLTRLRGAYTLATLSNADVNAVVSISRHCDFPWHAVFAAEMAGAFKPDPRTYHLAAGYLGLAPAEIMMVASHKYDIRAAAALGFRTAFVARPREFGDPSLADIEFSDEFDINATDFLDLAEQLDC